VAIVLVIVVAAVSGLVTLANLARVTTAIIILASIAYFALMLTSDKVTPPERSRVRAFIPLFIANAAFWSLFQQIFTTLAVYSDERMNWTIFGWTAPSNWIGSEEPIWIILLSPIFAVMWTKLGNRAPSTPMKFAIGVIGMGVAFLLFLTMAGGTGKTSPALAVFFILGLFAMAELMISPIGLSVTTKLAPDAFRAQMMALYFFSVGLGTSLSGVLARFYAPDNEYAYFGINGAVVIAIGLVVAALTPWIRRMMEGVH
jgi:POT family proton-dependent oligopeptide transporter